MKEHLYAFHLISPDWISQLRPLLFLFLPSSVHSVILCFSLSVSLEPLPFTSCAFIVWLSAYEKSFTYFIQDFNKTYWFSAFALLFESRNGQFRPEFVIILWSVRWHKFSLHLGIWRVGLGVGTRAGRMDTKQKDGKKANEYFESLEQREWKAWTILFPLLNAYPIDEPLNFRCSTRKFSSSSSPIPSF